MDTNQLTPQNITVNGQNRCLDSLVLLFSLQHEVTSWTMMSMGEWLLFFNRICKRLNSMSEKKKLIIN